MFIRSYKEHFGSTNVRCNSKNNNEEDGIFYVLDSLARSEMKRNNYYNSNKEIQKDKTAIKKRTCNNFTNRNNLNNEHFLSSTTTTHLQKKCSQFKETDTQGCDFTKEFCEIEHNSDANIESEKRTQFGLESSLIFISKNKQSNIDEDAPEMNGEPNSLNTKLFKSKKNPNSNTSTSITRQINDDKMKLFQNSTPEFSETCTNSDLSSCGKDGAYMNDDSYKFGCSETYIVIHGKNRKQDTTISDSDKKIIKTTLSEEIVIPKKYQNTSVFDKKCEAVNTKDVIDHPTHQRKKLSKHSIHFVEKSKECLHDEQTGYISIQKTNMSRKCLTSKADDSASEKELSKINCIDAKRSCEADEARVTKTNEIKCSKSFQRDYSNMTKYERTRELKRIYGKSSLNKSHSQRKVQHSVQNPEWVF